MLARRIVAGLIALIASVAAPALAPAFGTARAAPPSPVLVVATPTGSHVVGRATAPVKLVEYVSYTCPHCAHFETEAGDTILLLLVRPGKVSVEYRPLLRNVVDAAATLMVNCGPPARFQRNHAMVMRNQAKWFTPPTDAQAARWSNGDLPNRLRAIATDLKLYDLFDGRGYTRADLDRCLGNEALLKTIAQENRSAMEAGVQSTPSFLVNGKLQDAHSWDELRPVLEAATR